MAAGSKSKNIYTLLKHLEKSYPKHIVEIDDYYAPNPSAIIHNNKSNLRDKREFDTFYSIEKRKFLFFEKESGKQIKERQLPTK